MTNLNIDHAFIAEHLAAYLTGGLEPDEHLAFDHHLATCPACTALVAAAAAMDRSLQSALAAARPDALFESRLLASFRESTMHKRLLHPMAKRIGYALAASVALAATGVLANFMIESGRLSNPLSQHLLATTDRSTLPYLPLPHGFGFHWGKSAAPTISVRGPAESDADRKAHERLDANVAELSAEQNSLQKVLQYLQEKQNVNIQVNWQALQDAGVEKNTQVTVNLKDVTLRKALNAVLSEAGPKAELGFTVDEGAIAVSTKSDLQSQKYQVIRIYDIRDLLVNPPAISTPPTFDLSSVTASGTTTGGSGAGGGSLFSGPSGPGENDYRAQAARDNIVKDVTSTITSTVAPETWRENAGNIGSIKELNGQLIVSQTKDNQMAVANLLNQIAERGPDGSHAYLAVTNQQNFVSNFNQSTRGTEIDNSRSYAFARPADRNLGGDSLDGIGGGGTSGGSLFGGGGGSGAGGGKFSDSTNGSAALTADVPHATGTPALTITGATALGTSTPFAMNGRGDGTSAGDRDGKNVGYADAHAKWPILDNIGLVNEHYFNPSAANQKTPASPYDIIMVPGRSLASLDDKSHPGSGPTGERINGLLREKKVDKELESSESNAPHETSAGKEIGKVSETDTDADHRYALLKLKPQVSNLDGSDAFVTPNPKDRPHPTYALNTDSAPPATAPSTGQPSVSPPAPSITAAQIAAQRKIIRSGNLEVEVKSFDDTAVTIAEIVTEEGGYVSSSSSDRLANGKIRGSITVRVPPEHLDRMVLKLRGLGEIKSQQIAAADVTKQYTDLESELRALRAMEERLINIIKTGKGEVKDLVEAEKTLGEYKVRIEKIEGEVRYYNNLVALSTLTITCYEKDIRTPAALTESENVNFAIEVEDVEAKYAAARKAIDDAKGRITEGDLKKLDAGQFAARIVCEVPQDRADLLTGALKNLGNVVRLERTRQQTKTGDGGTGPAPTGSDTPLPNTKIIQADTRFTIALYNLANIAPRETSVLTVAVPNVEEAYRTILTQVRAAGAAPAAGGTPVGRVINSNLTGQRPEQMTADLRADIRAEAADAVLQSVRGLGETLASSTTENPDTANVTTAKRGLQLRLVALASVGARETITLQLAALNVQAAYDRLRALPGFEPATTQLLRSDLTASDPRTAEGNLDFYIRTADRALMDKALNTPDVDIMSRQSARSNDTVNTLETKTRYSLRILSSDQLPPLRTVLRNLEVSDVAAAVEQIRAAATDPAAQGQVIDSSLTREANGQDVGKLVLEIPVASADAVLRKISALSGIDRGSREIDNPQAPPSKLSRDRIELTLANRATLIKPDQGIWPSVRSALASSANALLYSLYWVVTGVLFLVPWVIIFTVGAKLYRRLRRRPA